MATSSGSGQAVSIAERCEVGLCELLAGTADIVSSGNLPVPRPLRMYRCSQPPLFLPPVGKGKNNSSSSNAKKPSSSSAGSSAKAAAKIKASNEERDKQRALETLEVALWIAIAAAFQRSPRAMTFGKDGSSGGDAARRPGSSSAKSSSSGAVQPPPAASPLLGGSVTFSSEVVVSGGGAQGDGANISELNLSGSEEGARGSPTRRSDVGETMSPDQSNGQKTSSSSLLTPGQFAEEWAMTQKCAKNAFRIDFALPKLRAWYAGAAAAGSHIKYADAVDAIIVEQQCTVYLNFVAGRLLTSRRQVKLLSKYEPLTFDETSCFERGGATSSPVASPRSARHSTARASQVGALSSSSPVSVSKRSGGPQQPQPSSSSASFAASSAASPLSPAAGLRRADSSVDITLARQPSLFKPRSQQGGGAGGDAAFGGDAFGTSGGASEAELKAVAQELHGLLLGRMWGAIHAQAEIYASSRAFRGVWLHAIPLAVLPCPWSATIGVEADHPALQKQQDDAADEDKSAAASMLLFSAAAAAERDRGDVSYLTSLRVPLFPHQGRAIVELSIRHCGLRQVSALSELLSLERVNLSNNAITEVPREVFTAMRGLVRLVLDSNEIEELPQLHGVHDRDIAPQLEHLSVAYNRLSRIPRYVTDAMPKLTHIDFAFNVPLGEASADVGFTQDLVFSKPLLRFLSLSGCHFLPRALLKLHGARAITLLVPENVVQSPKLLQARTDQRQQAMLNKASSFAKFGSFASASFSQPLQASSLSSPSSIDGPITQRLRARHLAVLNQRFLTHQQLRRSTRTDVLAASPSREADALNHDSTLAALGVDGDGDDGFEDDVSEATSYNNPNSSSAFVPPRKRGARSKVLRAAWRTAQVAVFACAVLRKCGMRLAAYRVALDIIQHAMQQEDAAAAAAASEETRRRSRYDSLAASGLGAAPPPALSAVSSASTQIAEGATASHTSTGDALHQADDAANTKPAAKSATTRSGGAEVLRQMLMSGGSSSQGLRRAILTQQQLLATTLAGGVQLSQEQISTRIRGIQTRYILQPGVPLAQAQRAAAAALLSSADDQQQQMVQPSETSSFASPLVRKSSSTALSSAAAAGGRGALSSAGETASRRAANMATWVLQHGV